MVHLAEADKAAQYRPTESSSSPAESYPTQPFPKRWRGPCLALALLYLFWLALCAAHLGPPADWRIAPVLGNYSRLSGTGTGFGYFSPEILSQVRGRFEILRDDGARESDRLEAGLSREGRLRAEILIGSIAEKITEKEARQQLARSWAANILARHPHGRRVSAVIEEYELPSLVDYPGHPVVGWRPFYRITFEGGR